MFKFEYYLSVNHCTHNQATHFLFPISSLILWAPNFNYLNQFTPFNYTLLNQPASQIKHKCSRVYISNVKSYHYTNRIAITSLGRACMMVRVIISKTTWVPVVSFTLSTLLRQPTTYLGPLHAFTIIEAIKAKTITLTVLKHKSSSNNIAFTKSYHFYLEVDQP